MKTGFSPLGIDLQGVPCEPYRVWVCNVVLCLGCKCQNSTPISTLQTHPDKRSVRNGGCPIKFLTIAGRSHTINCISRYVSNCNYCALVIINYSQMRFVYFQIKLMITTMSLWLAGSTVCIHFCYCT